MLTLLLPPATLPPARFADLPHCCMPLANAIKTLRTASSSLCPLLHLPPPPAAAAYITGQTFAIDGGMTMC